MKMKFELEESALMFSSSLTGGTIKIIGTAPECKPYVSITPPDGSPHYLIQDKDLKLFAKNLMKALYPKKQNY